MRTNTLNPLHSTFPAALLTTAKIILPLLIILYGVFNFSVHYWILLGLLVVAIMAISDRLSHINASYKKDSTNNSNLSKTDGGTFSQTEKSKPTGILIQLYRMAVFIILQVRNKFQELTLF